ncbi:Retrovirus-related Pol polyprotein from transposon TNT 1-94 [Sarcoptes scabiei]|uniref:Retrovirus-related Pol polyprotein from transposon TNT 1-94 n=1 Tax=Sarcoptes scabiei TaxID=52283 RepID=A0A834VFZ7_SARSC|nr:Retrovirus-related Pol polyprotein from transposon TNT 1-94 [Sarcoptes scabiei]
MSDYNLRSRNIVNSTENMNSSGNNVIMNPMILKNKSDWFLWKKLVTTHLRASGWFKAIEEELDDDAEANIMAFNRILSSIDPTVLIDLDELILDWQNLNAVENILSESAFVLIIVTRCVGKIPHAETFTSNDEKLEIQNVFPSLIAWASSATMNFDLKCTKCQKFGHVASNCRSTTKISNNSNPFTNKTDSENYYSNCVMSKVDELLKNNWILDSGADNHFTGDLQKLHHITEVDDAYVRTPIGTHKITHCGILNLKNSGPEFSIKVFFIPGFQSNCISLSKLKKDGYSVNYSNSNGNWTISNGDDGVTTTNVDGLTIINCNAVSKIFRPALLHRRFGHSSKFSIENCEICLLNKMKKRSFNKCPATTDDILGRIFSDICGPLVTSTEDFKYFITFIDEKSRFCGIFTIRDRSEAFRCFKQFVDWAETQTGKRVKSLLTDNAKEYRSEKFENFCLAKGIERIEIPPHTPQQNGIAERKNQSLLSMVRCMLSEKQLPMTFWSYAVREANRILNRIPSKATNMLMPYEIFYNRKPNVDNIRVFGSLVYKHIPSSNKLQPRAVPQILILEDRCFDFKKHEIEIENIQNLEISIEEDNVKEDHEYSKPAMKFSNFSVKSKAAFPVPDSFEEVMNSDYKQYCGILVDESPTEKPIRELIGGLNYVAHWTRPDICAAVNLLSRKMHHPTKGAWKSCVQILRYLLSTSDWKLKLEGKNEECEVYADADFATDKESRASQSGIFIKIFGSPIAWSSNKQKCKSTSSSEAELIAASKAIKEATGFRNILNEVNESIKLPMTLFEDNKNCLHYLKNLCPKHIDIDRKYNEDQILRGIIKPIYLESSKQLADILTKVGGRINYKNLIPHLCLVKGGMLDDRLSIPR